ncbi:MAG: ABC transporter ATP-binding protein [Nitriliruptorales bacterium]|nr:ABC transporter ATP-binding protein [Nitriliruptorales bacterium]
MSDTATVPVDLSEVPHEPGAQKPDPILVVDDVRRAFGGLVAVDVDHLEIQRGIITALIGPNGAGKTTLFNLLSGFDDPDRGRWVFEGDDISGMPAHKIAQQGMVRTFQLTKALHKMHVIDNMKLGATGQRGESMLTALIPGQWRNQERDIESRADDLLERFKLKDKRHEYAGELSGGQRKLLEMARALMVQPSLLLLDEPMAGVNPALTQSLLGHVEALRDEGMSIVFVEHDMDVVMGISDWVVCMAEGKVIAEGTPESIGSNTAVIDAYLGETHDEPIKDAKDG